MSYSESQIVLMLLDTCQSGGTRGLTLRDCVTISHISSSSHWRCHQEVLGIKRLLNKMNNQYFYSGDIIAQDRIPRPELLKEARTAATKHNTKMMICFGGNGRSNGFSVMARNERNRKEFLKNLADLIDKYEFDGVDYNWEYPGYRMGRGYLEEKEIIMDYEGLAALVRETRQMFEGSGRVVGVAYYPDTRQERLIRQFEIDTEVDLLYSMSYDQAGPNHSSRDLTKKTIQQAKDAELDVSKLCVGVPFYGRDNRGGGLEYVIPGNN